MNHPAGRPKVDGRGRLTSCLCILQVSGRSLAPILLDIVADLLAFLEMADAGALDGGDVDEDILPAILRLDEAVALRGVKPFDRSDCHSFLDITEIPLCVIAQRLQPPGEFGSRSDACDRARNASRTTTRRSGCLGVYRSVCKGIGAPRRRSRRSCLSRCAARRSRSRASAG